jgi:molybdate transport system substrate-binding protein
MSTRSRPAFAVGRRRFLQALPALPVVAAATAASAATTDVVLTCDTTLRAPMLAAAGRFYQQTQIRVRVFPTGPGLILPQLERQVQNDMVFTQRSIADGAVREGLIDPAALRGSWRNKLVIAVPRKAGAPAATGRIAVSDATSASDMDGPAIIRSAGLEYGTVLGVIDTDEVVYLLERGQADAGLLHMTDVRANPTLDVLRVVPDEVGRPILYAAAVTKLSWRPNPQAFIDFLLTPAAGVVLTAHGLEAIS